MKNSKFENVGSRKEKDLNIAEDKKDKKIEQLTSNFTNNIKEMFLDGQIDWSFDQSYLNSDYLELDEKELDKQIVCDVSKKDNCQKIAATLCFLKTKHIDKFIRAVNKTENGTSTSRNKKNSFRKNNDEEKIDYTAETINKIQNLYLAGKKLALEEIASKDINKEFKKNGVVDEEKRQEYTKLLALEAAKKSEDWDDIQEEITEKMNDSNNLADFDKNKFAELINDYASKIFEQRRVEDENHSSEL